MQANLVIVGSGLATRVNDIHQGLYPKLLMNMGNQTLLDKIINSYNLDELLSITIIVPSKKSIYQINEAYVSHQDHDIVDKINFAIVEEPIGTARTIYQCLKNGTIPNKNVILAWSDIYATDFKLPQYSGITIFVDKTPQHRINFDGHVLETMPYKNGNVPGMFFIPFLDELFNASTFDFEKEVQILDLTDILKDLQETHGNRFIYRKQEVDIVDVGDLSKYSKVIEDVDITARYFNQLTIGSDTVTKTSTTEHGHAVIKNEIEFYLNLDLLDQAREWIHMPQLHHYNGNSFVMQRLQNSITVHEHMKMFSSSAESERRIVWIKFQLAIATLHGQDHPEFSSESIKVAMQNEYVDVTRKRLLKMSSLLPELSFVNTHPVDIEETMELLEFGVDQMANATFDFCLIHGDPNTSNTMIDEDGKISFIDPRGTFGGIQFYGDARYDHAKFLYGLTGYDKFNLTKNLKFKYNNEKKSILIPEAEEIIEMLDSLTSSKMLKFLVGVIWLKLPYYTINNINKSIAAYAIGQRLINHYKITPAMFNK